MCGKDGKIVPASVVDHIKPHREDRRLFWAQWNWQPLCKDHHDAAKQREDHRGYSGAAGVDGWPVDARHPSNRQGHHRPA